MIWLTILFVSFLVLSINLQERKYTNLENTGSVNGIPPCPPVSGYLHTWEFDEKVKDLRCSKCNRTPGDIENGL